MAENWTLHVDKDAANDPVFVGVGELKTGKFPDRGFIEALTKVAILALRDAGMVPKDIDTILLIPNLHSGADQADLVFSRMVEELGIHGTCKAIGRWRKTGLNESLRNAGDPDKPAISPGVRKSIAGKVYASGN